MTIAHFATSSRRRLIPIGILALSISACGGVVPGFAVEGGHGQVPPSSPPGSLFVEPTYSNLGEWNAYVKRDGSTIHNGSGTACDPATDSKFSDCVHGGELRQLRLPSAVSSCAGLIVVDDLGAFDWTCAIRYGSAQVYSVRLKDTKGVRDLIDPVTLTWRPNAVRVSGAFTSSTRSTVWWPNPPIVQLPANVAAADLPVELDRAGTVYVTTRDVVTRGYNVAADRVSIVTLGSAKLTYTGVATPNCNVLTGLTASPTASTLICGGWKSFAWIEVNGSANAQPLSFIVRLTGMHFARLSQSTLNGGSGDVTLGPMHGARLTGLRTQSIGLSLNSFDGGLVSDLRVAEGQVGFVQSDGNVLERAIVAGGARGLVLNQSAGNVVSRVALIGSNDVGLAVGNVGADDNVLSFVTSLNHRNTGVGLVAGAGNLLLHNALVANNGDNGVVLHEPSSISHLASVDNLVGLNVVGDRNKFSGQLLVGANGAADCQIDSGPTAPGLSAACAGVDRSLGFLTTTTGRSSAASFVGRVTTDDVVNAGDVMGGAATYPGLPGVFDFLNFVGPGARSFESFRAWIADAGPYPTAPAGSWSVAGGAGRIFDSGLSALDSVVRNTVGTGAGVNAPIVADAACPNWLSGNRTITDRTGARTFLANAYEVIGDGLGNDNGLCESNEACVAAPNFGAYQGDGDPTGYACVFGDGIVSGVTMRYHPVNGRAI